MLGSKQLTQSSPEVPGGPAVLVRHEPVQARASRRVATLLDAAASVVDSHGVEHLTTALVAERAGASIGTLYRYFPDRVALLAALAGRNAEQLAAAFEEAIDPDHSAWPVALDEVLDALIRLRETVPSYRAIHAGELLDLGPAIGERATSVIFNACADRFLERWGKPSDRNAREGLATAIGAADGLITYAFLRNPAGEERYVEMARRLAHDHARAVLGQ